MSPTDVDVEPPRPFRVSIPQSAVDKVIKAAEAVDFSIYHNNILSKDIDETDFTYGLPPVLLTRLVERLKGGFCWPEWEEKINNMGEHGKIIVKGIDGRDDIDMHFVHARSSNPDAKAVIFAHGWPGSFFEFYRIIPHLIADYHVVVPSMPGYTFSSAPKNINEEEKPAPWSFTQTAQTYDAVMRGLGYNKYFAQGGDWGSMIVQRVAQLFPERCKAIHLNFVFPHFSHNDHLLVPSDPSLTPIEKKGVEGMNKFMTLGQAYFHMQGTTPYTLGAVLSSSPIATIIYIGEKMLRWCNPEALLPIDFVLANSLLYWFTGSLTSSMWLYYDVDSSSSQKDLTDNQAGIIKQPTAFGFGGKEILWLPRHITERELNVRSWRVLEDGGHFLAAEEPEILAFDMKEHFESEEVKKAW